MHQNVKEIVNQIHALPSFPLSRWSCSDDASGTALTLSRQRRWIVDQLKEKFGLINNDVSPTKPDPEDLREALARIVRAVEDVDCREDWIPALQAAKSLLKNNTPTEPVMDTQLTSGLEDDFNQAARFYAARSFGADQATIAKELRRRFEEDDTIDAVVALFTQHREKYIKLSPDGFIQVPCEPTTEMWDGLARTVIDWISNENRKTPRSLLYMLRTVGIAAPQWLIDEPDMAHMDHVVSKGTRAVIVFKAMVEGYAKSKVITAPIDGALRKALVTSTEKIGDLFELLPVKCTCLSELESDAYEPGGPSSGHPLPPPCKLHTNG